MTYVGKSTFGDLTKTAKEAAKKGLVKTDSGNQQSPTPPQSALATSGQGKDFFSSISSDMNSIASSTTSMFSGISGLFGDKKQKANQSNQQQMQQQKPKEPGKISFDPFPGRKGLAPSLIRHSGPKHTQEELQRIQNAERSSSNSENQAFLKDVVQQVLAGEGVGWLKFNRLKKLMEDESYRILVLGKLNKTLDRKIAPDDHIDDICVPKPVWKGILKVSLASLAPCTTKNHNKKLLLLISVASSGDVRVGADLCQLWTWWNGERVRDDGNLSHALLVEGAA